MDLKFTIQTKINKPIEEVFDAIVNPKKLTGYFAGTSSGPLEEGKKVIWGWNNHGDCEVTIQQLVPNTSIVLGWEASGGDYTKIVMEFEKLEADKTLVKITESGWQSTDKGLKGSYKNCEGWQHMLCCLKAYLQHGIDLRK